jgi:hypothetical protein
MSEEVKPKKPAKAIERVTVADPLKGKLTRLAEEANAALQGIASITKSDVVNMILEHHGDALSQMEVEHLKARHVDQVKLALWLAESVREAKRAGEAVSLRELLERCESALSPKKARAAPRIKGKKPKSAEPPREASPSQEVAAK